MQLVYAHEPFPENCENSIFLAGPTPRSMDVKSWRPEAITLFYATGYNGALFIPEPRDGKFGKEYDFDAQVDWEEIGLELASCILFWIPRNLENMPGFTTNVEFGLWVASGKTVLGAPEDAPKMRYLRRYARKYKVPQATNLKDTVAHALKSLKNNHPNI